MYIDAKQIGYRIFVSERQTDGTRNINTHLPPYTFYYTDHGGEITSIRGDKLRKFRCHKRKEFEKELAKRQTLGKTIFESDVPVLFRLLEERYPGDVGPDLHISFLDIEVDKDPERGFAHVTNPYAEINAITVYNKWNDEVITIMVPPENLTMEEAQSLLDGGMYQDEDGNLIPTCPEGDDFGEMSEGDGYYLVNNEAMLLELFLDIIEDSDVLSGWNSTYFDIPYIIQRMRHVLGGESLPKLALEDGSDNGPYRPSEKSMEYINRMNLFPCPPTLRHVEHFGSVEPIYLLHGRVHLDYLELYRKFTYEELHSYTLDFILQHEVNQKKIPYKGSLDQLYRLDFRRFTAYNRQDTMGLSAIDDKRKMISLANNMAHMAGVTLDKVLGSVVIIEQAILKELHKKKLICFDKTEMERDYPIPGAFVLEPQKGVYNWIASYDFNSLYPTVIRMLNISPETIVGYIVPNETLDKLFEYMSEGQDGAEAWSHFAGTLEYQKVVERSEENVVFRIEGKTKEDCEEITMTGAEAHDMIRENDWVITAFGLVNTREREGIIPFCLSKWYDLRTVYKKRAKTAYLKADKMEDGDEKEVMGAESAYYDQLQLIQKIFLNSTYGALLNRYCRFFDPRMGASVTMSGRISLMMMADYADKVMEEDLL